ncbi:ATP-binding cassette domain-containing protein [Curtobacterium sp. SGAir0471]|uniref:ATP-binding cassette domain-containing protein n=1 Tax=Curtobacterium sp. SGAir0471 TaxID=2070337 RepID=UPI001586CD49|nr:ATP-binding cassette domain-containing protein [Curtobacterium sp. SGAir0471]
MQVTVAGASIQFGSKVLFHGLDAVFPSGRLTALVGPSGSGKSSLLAAIAGFSTLDEGSVSYSDGTCPPTAPDPSSVTWVSQSASSLGSRSVLDNVLVGPLAEGLVMRDAVRRARAALDEVGLGKRERERLNRLSGGEVQRVALARGLATEKRLILADEPTASLDADNTRKIAALLLSLRSRATIVVATHDPILIQTAEGVVALREHE